MKKVQQISQNRTLTPLESSRYARHLALPEVGLEGQERLKSASVLVVGVGGLGSPVSLYLAAAGVGTIGLVEFDVVDVTNLQRQILYEVQQTGKDKLACAEERLLGLNPEIEIRKHPGVLGSDNALDVISGYDLVVDGTDNFPTRYLVNDACVLLDKPNIYGSIFRFEGQASVFHHKGGPCYRCIYPEPPPAGMVPSCAEGGVLGVLPGIVGSIQATEAIKVILGKSETLAGRFLLVDALSMRFTEMKIHRDPDCPVCGERPTVTGLIDYDQFCGVKRGSEEGDVAEVSPTALDERFSRGDDITLLDVREPYELQISRFENAVLIPSGELEDRLDLLDPEKEIVVICRTGRRSREACLLLQKKGFQRVSNLAGGINAWATDVDPEMPVY